MKATHWMLFWAALAVPSIAWTENWEPIGPNGGWNTDKCLDREERILATAARAGIYRSSAADEPWHWEQIYTGPAIDPRSIAANDAGHIFVGTDGSNGTGFVRSTDDRVAWEVVNNSLSSRVVTDLLVAMDQSLWACTAGFGLYRSTNNGTTFTQVGALPASYPSFIRQSAGGHLFVGAQHTQTNLYRSTDDGATWHSRDTGINSDVLDLCFGDPEGASWYAVDGSKVYRTTNEGASWTDMGAPATPGYISVATMANVVYVAHFAEVFAGGKVLRSSDGGATWPEDSGLPGQPLGRFLCTPGWLYLSVLGPGPYRRSENGEGWEQKACGMFNTFVTAVVADEDAGRIYAVLQQTGIHESSDGGVTWQAAGTGIPVHEHIYSMVISSDGLRYASGAYGGIYVSVPGGAWDPVFQLPATALGSNDQGHVYAGYGNRIYRTTNQGVDWAQVAQLPAVQGIADLACVGNDVYAATGVGQSGSRGVFRSTNDGGTWAEFNDGLTVLNVTSIGVDPDQGECRITAGTGGGAFDLQGSVWVFNSSYGEDPVKRVRKGMDFKALISESRLSSSEEPCFWEDFTGPARYNADFGTFRLGSGRTGGEPQIVQVLGTLGYGLWRAAAAPPSAVVAALPRADIVLRSASDNPSGTGATLEYGLTRPGMVRLRVFDASGREVASLVEGWRNTGNHRVRWDAAGHASGVYFARLATGLEVRTRTVVLVR